MLLICVCCIHIHYTHCNSIQPIINLFRVGLIGNPSDGFNGKTISLTIGNFWAEVTIKPSTKLVRGQEIVLISFVHYFINKPFITSFNQYTSHNPFILLVFIETESSSFE